jgi:hypothetical protein
MAIYNPYRTRPDDETVTPNFGGARSISFTDPNTINRQRALADLLRQQSMIPLQAQSAGGYVIPPSPMQGIAKLGEAAAAVFAEKKAREKEEANKQLRSDAVAKALRLQQEGVADTIQPPSIPLSAQSSGGSYVPPTQEIRRKPTQTEVLGALAEGGPKMEELIAESQIKNLLADASGTSKGSFGKTPQIIRMADGTLRLFQVNDQGEGKFTEMPEGSEGAEVVRNLVKIDRGGVVDLANPFTGDVVISADKTLDPKDQPKNIKEIEGAKTEAKVKDIEETTEPEVEKTKAIEKAKTEVQAEIDFPSLKAESDYMIDLVQRLIDHPGREIMTGTSAKFMPKGGVPGFSSADFRTLLDQIEGKQFMTAYKTLKGGGQITEIEGKKATEALARLNTAQSEKGFLEAAKEFIEEVKKLTELAKERIGQEAIYLD